MSFFLFFLLRLHRVAKDSTFFAGPFSFSFWRVFIMILFFSHFEGTGAPVMGTPLMVVSILTFPPALSVSDSRVLG